MCVAGNPIKAEEALKFGIIDRIIEGDLLAGAVAVAREKANKPAPKTRERNEELGGAMDNELIFSSAREAAAKKQRGLLALVAAIDAVEAATRLSFQQGCKVEQKLFLDCLFSEQSKSLIRVFSSEREVSKIPDIPKETAVIPIKSAAVGTASRLQSRRHSCQ
jgi:3-hydroxyacyl-CoA dehydrogenase